MPTLLRLGTVRPIGLAVDGAADADTRIKTPANVSMVPCSRASGR